MKKPSPSTPKSEARRLAEIYREAARIVEERLHPDSVAGWSCLAIAKAVKGDAYTGSERRDGFYYGDLPEVKAYIDLYPDYVNFAGCDDHRVIALCMMAEITERP